MGAEMKKSVACNGNLIADKVLIADSYFKRLRGLLGKTQLQPGEGLLLTKVASVHCFFMKFTIDVVYLSDDMVVTGIETIPPWRVGKWIRGTSHTLELEEGKAQSHIKKGDQLSFTDSV
jgi:hypothetical protein